MIYFIEDDDNIRKLVCYALSHEGYEVTGLSTPRAFRAKLHSCLPELILLDIMLPEEDGLSILKWLKSEAATGLDLGADDYISKPFGMTELLSRVRAVLRRYEKTRIPSEKTYSIGKLFVDPSKHIIEVASSPVTLSFKEYSLLLMLLEADGRVVSRNDLLTKIWGEFYDDSRTLDVHIRKLRVKLGICGELIRTVKSIGYKLGGDGDE